MGTPLSTDKGIKAYARRHSTTPAAVRKGIREGRVPVDAAGRIKLGAADAALAEGTVQGPRVSRTLALARRRKLRAAVQLLDHELTRMRANVVTAAELHTGWLLACRAIATEVERMLTVKVPRTTAAAAFAVLRDQVDGLLARLLDCLPEELVAAKAEPERPDLMKMSEIKLATRRADLQSEKMELQHAVMRGDLIKLDRVVAGMEDRIGRCRSLLLGIPSRASPMLEMDEVQGRQVFADDMCHALIELAGYDVKVDDYIPATLVEAARPRRRERQGEHPGAGG